MQMELKKCLHEQVLEVKRELQMSIECRYLQKIMEEEQELGSVLKVSEASQSADTEAQCKLQKIMEELGSLLKVSEALQSADTEDMDKPSDSPSTPDSSAHPPSPRKKQKLDDSSSGGGISPPLQR